MKNCVLHVIVLQVKNVLNFLLPNHELDRIIILRECSLDRGLQNSFIKKKETSKNMAFMVKIKLCCIYKVFGLVQGRLLCGKKLELLPLGASCNLIA